VRIDPVPVTTADDPRVDAYLRLTDIDLRQASEPARGLFIAEGHLVIERCAAQGLGFLSVLTARRWLARLEGVLAGLDVDVLVADDDVMQSITGFRVHRGALAAVARPTTLTVDDVLADSGDVLLLEDLVDPTNVGLAIRSAVVQGIDRVIVSPECADPLYRRAVKSSMGAVLRCHWSRSEDWPRTLAAVGHRRRLIALTPDGQDDLDTALLQAGATEVALMVGAEGPGLSAAAAAAAWRRCAIPMAAPGDSLNVAAATAIACYARRRHSGALLEP
jgi:tRNA G18 (ribose-2'-O)-methylase SpoU